jgi:hypothetical protein
VDPRFADLTAGGYRTVPAAPEAEMWFGPHVPIAPQAPPEAAARALDYPVAYNLYIQPRAGELVPFEMMRAFAEAEAITRTCIETRKDQMVKLKNAIRGKEGSGVKEDDKRIAEIENFLRYPDRSHSWQAWLRMLLEDVFVIDAPCLYPRQALNGQLYALEIVDGATIVLKIDANGRTPVPPAAAYQQVLHGIPATDYTAEDLIYIPRNPRPHKFYGYSPVEQILMILNIALRRQLFQLHFYTEGNVPEGFAEVPPDWSPDQIAQFQAWWDAILAGRLEERRRMRFIPAGTKPVFPKLEGLKDDFDEWYVRIVCYAFSLPPTPFVRQMNRAVAQSSQQAALEEGLQPLMSWIKDLMDYIIWRFWGYYDLEFTWQEEESVAPDVQAKINATDVGSGIRTRTEVRQSLGLDPDEYPDFIVSTQGVVVLADIGKEPEPQPQPQPRPDEKGGGPEPPGPASGQTPPGSSAAAPAQKLGKDQEDWFRDYKIDLVKAPRTFDFPFGYCPYIPEAKTPEEYKAAVEKLSEIKEQAAAEWGIKAWDAESIGRLMDRAKPLIKAAIAKAKKKIERIDRERPEVVAAREQIQELFEKAFKKDAKAAAKQIARGLKLSKGSGIRDQGSEKALTPVAGADPRVRPGGAHTGAPLQKAEDDEARIDKLLARLDLAGIAATREQAAAILAKMAQNGGVAAFVQIDFEDEAITSQVNELAVAWAADHAADLVTKIDEATREFIRADVTQAMQEGWSTGKLADTLADNYGFSSKRAGLIARTEAANADQEGNFQAYKASGVVEGTIWLLGSEHSKPDECDDNADEGMVALGEEFPSGDLHPPAHPE